MQNHLEYNDIIKVVTKINSRNYDYETPFFDKVDEVLDTSEGKHVETVLMEAFEKLLSQVSTEINTIEQEMSLKPTCALGCAHCCYFPIVVTRLEVKLMLMFIKRLPDERRQSITDHIATYLQRHNTELEQLRGLDFKSNPTFKDTYKKMELPCIMLDMKTNTCMAYEVRPIPCRTYVNYADPLVCKEERLPKEPLSYEFMHPFYVQGMDEVIQEILEVVNDSDLGFSYPADAADVNYLPILLKEELDSMMK